MSDRPTELAFLVVAMGKPGIFDGWLYADEVRFRLRMLGFDPSSQYVVGRLNAMCNEDTPRFERRDHYDREKQYRISQWGRNELDNKLPTLRRWT